MNKIRFGLLIMIMVLTLAMVGCGEETPQEQTASSGPVGYFNGVTSTVLTADSVKKQVAEGALDITITAGQSEDPSEEEPPVQGVVTLGMSSDEFKALLEEAGFDTTSEDVRRTTEDNAYVEYRCFGAINGYYTNDDRENGLVAVVYYDTAYGFEAKKTTKEQVMQVMGEPTEANPANDQMTKMFLMSQKGANYLDYDCGNVHVTFYFAAATKQLCATVIYQEGLWIM
ncbi:MAG: hypothetical protein IKT68_06360 [Clostridia bacterium]|nr:hypothetical protein [Clostridia bacterium]